MKRKVFLLILCIAWITISITAFAAPSFSDKLFDRAKDALSLISYGEYGKAVEMLDIATSEADFVSLVESDLSDVFYVSVQRDVAVAYYTGKRWILAVPIEEPNGNVQAFALSSSDGSSFDAYRAMSWNDVLSGVAKSDDVQWNNAYNPGTPSLIADD